MKDRWDRLVAASERRTPYMSHAWLTSWWESFGAENELRVFVVRSGEQWIAAAPMMVHRTTMYGVPIRRLEAFYNHHTPRCDFPISDHNPEVYRLLWRQMSDPDASWDAVVLQQFSDDSPALNNFEAMAANEGWRTGRWIGPPSPFIPLDCDFDALFQRLRPREKSNLRKRFSRLSAIAPLQLEIVRSFSEVGDAMQDGMQIEAAAWKAQAGTAIVSNPQVRSFYTNYAERAAEAGELRLCFLRLGGKRIAFFYLLDSGGVIYALKLGYDPEYQRYSPGHMLLMLILKAACHDGCREFDFQGTAERWKLVWTTQSRRYPWLFMFRDRWRSRLLHRAKFVVLPAVRGLSRVGQ